MKIASQILLTIHEHFLHFIRYYINPALERQSLNNPRINKPT